MIKNKLNIDTSFDFTKDTPHFWEDDFWSYKNGLGGSKYDPDILSPTLQKYHQLLWSKQLPNKEFLDLQEGNTYQYLYWKDFRFGSDSIPASFRYERNRNNLEEIAAATPDYHHKIEDFIHQSYTIGGMIIFPKMKGSINQIRGTNRLISDRFDLTLECIRCYYNNTTSPLKTVMDRNSDFFKLFCNFKGYVDFFFLQDFVSQDYEDVIIWHTNKNVKETPFTYNPIPKGKDDYFSWIDFNLDLVNKRNARIDSYLSTL